MLTRTDARGVVTNYEYNNRGLVTGITWDVGSTGVTETAAVGFDYDNLGNRIEMTDGLGMQVYEYDSLSRLTAETRSFTDTLANAPSANNSFRLEYTYHLAGQLKSLKDPYGQQINYGHDRAGKMFSVWGSTSFAGISTYLGAVNYRAWGGVRSITYGNGNIQTTTFDEALRPAGFVLEKDSTAKISRAYEYNKDGSLNYVEDLLNPVFDRLQTYDHQGRLAAAFSGLEARGGTVTDPEDQKTQLPYRQTYGFNAFDNLTSRTNLNWGTDEWYGVSFDLSRSYQNDRVTGDYWWQYDADGRVTSSIDSEVAQTTYNAAGQAVRIMKLMIGQAPGYDDDIYNYHDGDGGILKRLQKDFIEEEPMQGYDWVDRPLQYFVRSSVLGGRVVSEANDNGKKLRTYVYAGSAAVSWQTMHYPEQGAPVEAIRFEHLDAGVLSRRTTTETGVQVSGLEMDDAPAEFDPTGMNAGTEDPYPNIEPPGGEGCIGCGNSGIVNIDNNNPIYINGRRVRHSIDGVEYLGPNPLGFLGMGATDLNLWFLDRATRIQLGISAIPSKVEGRGGEYWFFSRNANANGSQTDSGESSEDRCILRLVLAINNNFESEQLEVFKNELERIFGQIGVTIAFVSSEADFYLNVNSTGHFYSQNPNAIGQTEVTPDRRFVRNNGRVFVDRLVDRGAGHDPFSRGVFGRDPKRNLAIGLARAGAHEIGHYLLQQTDDSLDYYGIMRASFRGVDWFGQSDWVLEKWRFNLDQANSIRWNLCPNAPSIDNPGVPEL